MNKLLPLLMFLAVSVSAQVLPNSLPASSQDLGGVGDAIGKIAKAARVGTASDLKLHVTGILYVPWPAVHSADGKIEYAALGLGGDLGSGVEGTKLHGAPLILPLFNPAGIASYVFKNQWSQSHLSFADVGNFALGIGVKPLPVIGSHGKWIIGDQVEGVLTFGFGK